MFIGSGLTAILATSEELAKWVDSRNQSRTEGFRQAQQLREQEELRRLQAQEASTSTTNGLQSSPLKSMASAASDNTKFTFICECFFLTARVLNLGLIKALSDFKALVQVCNKCLYFNFCWGLNHLYIRVISEFSCAYFTPSEKTCTGQILAISILLMIKEGRKSIRFEYLIYCLKQELSRRKDELTALKSMRGDGAPAGLEQDILQAEAVVETLSQDRLCYDSQLLKVCLSYAQSP
jgi:hypothetical protein